MKHLVEILFLNIIFLLGHINLGKKGYRVPQSGTIQVTLFNPLGTVVKMFVVMYDLSDMPPNSQVFLYVLCICIICLYIKNLYVKFLKTFLNLLSSRHLYVKEPFTCLPPIA